MKGHVKNKFEHFLLEHFLLPYKRKVNGSFLHPSSLSPLPFSLLPFKQHMRKTVNRAVEKHKSQGWGNAPQHGS